MSRCDINQIQLLIRRVRQVVQKKKTARRKPLKKAEYEILADFRHALRQFLTFSEDAARSVGLKPQQHQALLAIKGFRGKEHITNGELAERLQIRHHSAVGLINRLATQGLIERFWGEEDKRKVYIKLTRDGEALVERLTAAHREEIQRIAPELRSI